MPNENEVKETWLSPRARHMLNHLIHFLPLIAITISIVVWVDTRYAHDEISKIRFTNLQIQVLENERDEFLVIENPTNKEIADHARIMQRLKTHEDQWNELLGITE